MSDSKEDDPWAEGRIRGYMQDFNSFAGLMGLKIAIRAVSDDKDDFEERVEHIVSSWTRDKKKNARQFARGREEGLAHDAELLLMRELKAIEVAEGIAMSTLLEDEEE